MQGRNIPYWCLKFNDCRYRKFRLVEPLIYVNKYYPMKRKTNLWMHACCSATLPHLYLHFGLSCIQPFKIMTARIKLRKQEIHSFCEPTTNKKDKVQFFECISEGKSTECQPIHHRFPFVLQETQKKMPLFSRKNVSWVNLSRTEHVEL